MQERGRVVDVLELLGIDFATSSTSVGGCELGGAGWFTEQNFYEACFNDVANAQSGVVIYSGFLTKKRVRQWLDLLGSVVRRGVKVRCITRPPEGNRDCEGARGAMRWLTEAGVSVDIQKNAHQKAVMVDAHVLWLGSLNPLSFTLQSREVMARIVSEKACLELARLNAPLFADSKSEVPFTELVQKEYPDCPQCAGLMSHEGWKNYICVDCGHFLKKWDGNKPAHSHSANKQSKTPAKPNAHSVSSPSTYAREQEKTPKCPKCGKKMKIRNGPKGKFWGCLGYPGCRGSRSVKQ